MVKIDMRNEEGWGFFLGFLERLGFLKKMDQR